MANQLEIRTTDPGFEKVQRDFDALPRSLKEIILRGSEVGQTFERMRSRADGAGRGIAAAGRSGSEAVQAMAGQAVKFVGALTGGISVVAAIQQGIAKVREHLEGVIAMQDKALKSQQTFAQALGKLTLNDRSLKDDPKTFQRYREASLKYGEALGEGGAARVATAAAGLRSGTFGASEDDRLKALEIAAKMAIQGGPDFNIEAAAIAITNTATSLKGKVAPGTEAAVAAGFVSEMGTQFAGAAAEVFAKTPLLIAAEQVGATKEQVSALFSMASVGTGREAGALATAIPRIITTAGEAPVVKRLDLQGGTNAEKLFDFIGKLSQAEDPTKTVGQFTGSAEDQLILLALANKQREGAMAASLRGFKGAFAGRPEVDMDLAFLAKEAPEFGRYKSILEEEGKDETGDVLLGQAERSAAQRRLIELASRFGDTEVSDFFRDERRMLKRVGDKPAHEFESEESDRIRSRAIARLLGSAIGENYHWASGMARQLPRVSDEARQRSGPGQLRAGNYGDYIEQQLLAIGEEFGPERMMAEAARFVSPRGGIDKTELQALKAAGVPGSDLSRVSTMYETGDPRFQEQFLQMMLRVHETLDKLPDRLAEANRQQPPRPAADLPD